MMEKFRFRKKEQEIGHGEVIHSQKQQPPSYPPVQGQSYGDDQKRLKQHTNWNGVLQDLFGLDSPQTAESTHESTSSGVASDVTSVYPTTPTMTTFKGGDSAGSASSAKSTGSDRHSQDSGTRSASISGSPRSEQKFQRQILRGPRMPPAMPLPAVPKEAPPLPTKNVPRLKSHLPHNDYHHMDSCTESPTMNSRGKKSIRERRPRLPEPNSVQNGNINNNSVRSLMAQQGNHDLHSPNPNSDPRAVDPSFYNEINQCCVETRREEHYFEPYGDDRFIESHLQEMSFRRDRLQQIPSPSSPVPPGGFYQSRQSPYGQHDHRTRTDTTPRDSRSRHKHHQLQHQQQSHQHYQCHHQQQIHQPRDALHQQYTHLSTATRNIQSPVNTDTLQQAVNGLSDHHNDLNTPQSRVGNERISPSNFQTNNLNKPSPTPNRMPHQNRRYTHEQESEHMTPRSQATTPRGSHTLLTHAQVHIPQQEVRGVRNEARMKSTHAQSESQLNCHSPNQRTTSRGGGALIGGVQALSLSQADINSNKNNNVISTNGKRLTSRASPFETLPNDVLLKIFSHLPTDHLCKCAQVCRHWYNAVWDHPILWTSIVINSPNIDIDKALKYLTRRLSYNTPKVCMILEKININSCCRLSDRGLQTVVKRCPELRYLDMQGCQLITNVGVTEAVSRCVNLERLDVTGCPQVTCITLMDSVINQSASRHLQRIYLRYLDMTDCPHVTDQDLSTVTSQCTQLLFFYLRRCPLITDLGVTYIANNCSSLRELSVSDCKSITDVGLRELAKLRDNLRYLSVAKCEKVSDQGVIHIAGSCSKLRYLNVRGCEAVSDRGLEYLARNCPRLRSLDIGKCDITDDGLYALSMYCPSLKKLGVKSCDAITDKGIVLVAYRCTSLQQLHVQDCCLSPDAYAMVRKYCKRAIIEHTNPAVL